MRVQFATALTFILSLLVTNSAATRASISCYETSDPGKRWVFAGNCALKSNNVYFCGSSGTSVGTYADFFPFSPSFLWSLTLKLKVHKQNQITIRAGSVDSTVIVTCNNKGYTYFCLAGSSGRFFNHACYNAVQSVSSVKDIN